MKKPNPTITHGVKIDAKEMLTKIAEEVRKEDDLLVVPVLLLKKYLVSIAQRCAKINDPVLNKLMVEMTMYEQGNAKSPLFNPQVLISVEKDYNKHIAEEFAKKISIS